MHRRVVITGAGVICAIGASLSEFWKKCLAGESNVSRIPEHWKQYANLKSDIWATLPRVNFDERSISKADKLLYDKVNWLTLNAAFEAISNSKLRLSRGELRQNSYRIEDVDPNRIGVYMGTGVGGVTSAFSNHSHHVLCKQKQTLFSITKKAGLDPEIRESLLATIHHLAHPRRFNPFVVSMLMPNAVSAVPGIKFSMNGPNLTYSVACASGVVAVGMAYRAIKRGDVDVALTGGSEYLHDYYGSVFRGFDAVGALVKKTDDPSVANRPFDRDRSGFLFSEGGTGILVVEELEHAKNRNAPILAEICGYGESFDAHNIMDLAVNGVQMERMIRRTLEDANVISQDVDYLNAHGTGTVANDETEVAVIEKVFGPLILVNSTKSLIGHTLGASGAIEVIVTALSLKNQKTHPCKNLAHPIANLNFVRSSEENDITYALCHSFGFGGHNAGLVMKRYTH